MHEKFMQRVLEIARQSLEQTGALPFGAVVVRDGAIVGEGLNRSQALLDPTSHGEIEAIRDACKRLGTTDLSGCDLYTSCEPCAMCAATMLQAGIARVFYAGDTVDGSGLFERLGAHDAKWRRRISSAELREQVGLPTQQRRMPSERLMAAENLAIFEEFERRNT